MLNEIWAFCFMLSEGIGLSMFENCVLSCLLVVAQAKKNWKQNEVGYTTWASFFCMENLQLRNYMKDKFLIVSLRKKYHFESMEAYYFRKTRNMR